jgi:hypothetical protein
VYTIEGRTAFEVPLAEIQQTDKDARKTEVALMFPAPPGNVWMDCLVAFGVGRKKRMAACRARHMMLYCCGLSFCTNSRAGVLFLVLGEGRE